MIAYALGISTMPVEKTYARSATVYTGKILPLMPKTDTASLE